MLAMNILKGERAYIDGNTVFEVTDRNGKGALVNITGPKGQKSAFIPVDNKLDFYVRNYEPISVTFRRVRGNRIVFSFRAAKHITIDREVIHLRKRAEASKVA